FLIVLVSLLSVLLSQCSDDPVAPDPPENIAIESGDQQYSYKGTLLPQPLVVRVTTAKNDVPEEAYVTFNVIAGGGTLSRTRARVNKQGLASAEYTLGSEVGTNIVNAALEEDASKSVQFEETSANFFCPEQEDTFRVSYGTLPPPSEELFLATHKTAAYSSPGSSGVVRIDALWTFTINRFAELPAVSFFDSRIYDAALSAKGELYVARLALESEIVKIDLGGDVTHFALLQEILPEPDPAVEIATNPSGLLVGCDVMGPFLVGCREQITRLDGATFPTGGVNNDALAVDQRRHSEDPLGEDIYFIYKPQSALLRLPMDSLTNVGGESEFVASLTAEQAKYARGMVCSEDGTIFILVDSDDTKQLLSVSPSPPSTVEVLVDFLVERGPYQEPGTMRDLAIRGYHVYLLDTYNNDILLYQTEQRSLSRRFRDKPETVRADLSTQNASGERVGLVVITPPAGD
ncbi:MAG: hypothetical protein JSW50_00085, partial [Candidatus Latescibacterota bacterium]